MGILPNTSWSNSSTFNKEHDIRANAPSNKYHPGRGGGGGEKKKGMRGIGYSIPKTKVSM